MEVDTIVSLSTAPGPGAIAVVRISGPDASRLLEELTAAVLPEERRATLMDLRDPVDDSIIDHALVTRFVAPASFTGEDLVEISCHGGWLIPPMVIEACVHLGARVAEAGEFTRRAYLHGKVDLIQAEAIADLIEGRSRALHRAAIGQLERGLSGRVSVLRERLIQVEALLAHHVDFPEEDDAPVSLARVSEEARVLIHAMEEMLVTAPEGELLREGALVVFAGRPNAGKSSLYNALVGEERAIVTDEPGTTRDALEASVQLGGFPFRLVDTAGLRASTDKIESLGIEVARRYLAGADVVLYCVASDEGVTESDLGFLTEARSALVVLVETKADLTEPESFVGVAGNSSERGVVADTVRVSVESGVGLDQVREILPRLVYSAVIGAGTDVPVLTRRRQALALGSARDEVAAFELGLREGLPAEVAATHLRSAESALEELVGLVSADDVLDVVFRDFCIGK